MQNRYTADIGDFAKYGLLRCLSGVTCSEDIALRLGIHWYLVPDEKNRDGRHLEYLDGRDEFRDCDPGLYEFLQAIKSGDEQRSVVSIERSGLLPPQTLYSSDILTYNDLPWNGLLTKQMRLSRRSAWAKKAQSTIVDADLVFLDPDTGFERRSVPIHTKKGPKYAFRSEIKSFIDQGQTTIVYQHQNYDKGGFEKHVRSLMASLSQEYTSLTTMPYCCLFASWGIRAFIILPCGITGKEIVRRASSMMADLNWKRYFKGISAEECLSK